METGLVTLLRRAAASERARIERALSLLKLTKGQFAILSLLQAGGEISSADAARAECLSPQTICITVRNLERAGLISRKIARGRVQLLELTQDGRRVAAAASDCVDGFEARLTGEMQASAARQIRSWLSRLAQR